MSSIKIAAGANVKRVDIFYVDPNEIIVDETLRGRHVPPTDEDIHARAESFRKQGQLQPVLARKLSDGTNRIQLIAGFTRVNAARLIRHGYRYVDDDGNEQEHCDPDFPIQVKLWQGNDEEALRAFISVDTEHAAFVAQRASTPPQ